MPRYLARYADSALAAEDRQGIGVDAVGAFVATTLGYCLANGASNPAARTPAPGSGVARTRRRHPESPSSPPARRRPVR